jgi:hypothetical protein
VNGKLATTASGIAEGFKEQLAEGGVSSGYGKRRMK